MVLRKWRNRGSHAHIKGVISELFVAWRWYGTDFYQDNVTTGWSEFLNKNVHQMVKRNQHKVTPMTWHCQLQLVAMFFFEYFNHLNKSGVFTQPQLLASYLFLPILLFLLLKSSYILTLHKMDPPCHQHLPTEGVRQSPRSFLKLRSPRVSYLQPAAFRETMMKDQSLGKHVKTFRKKM